MTEDVVKNYQKYLERVKLFKSFGYDIQGEREEIFETAQPIKSPILEIGTGKGHFAITLAQKGHRLTSIDISDEEQKYAKMNVEYLHLQEYVNFEISDAKSLKFKDGSFDTIFSVNVLHHLQDPYAVIDEAVRVLKKKGKIIFSDFSRKGMELVSRIHHSEGRQHPEGNVSIEHVGQYLAKQNFQVKNHRSVFQETLVAYASEAETT